MRARPPAEFGAEFLDWLREATEQAWAGTEDWSLSDFARAGLIGSRWRRGTRWTGGLDPGAVDRIQAEWSMRFPAQHRLFLEKLHSTTPWQRGADYSRYGNRLAMHDTPGFYDWMRDEREIRSAMAALADSGEAVRELLAELRHPCCARGVPLPDLIPIYGHRYVLAADPPWVLSILDEDAVVYGRDLRDYLLHELQDVLA